MDWIQQIVLLRGDDGARDLEHRALPGSDPSVAERAESEGSGVGVPGCGQRRALSCRCTRSSSAASETFSAVYTSACPGLFQRPP
jgi:hypothetical protein